MKVKTAIIKNRNEISLSKLRKQVLDILEAGVERVLPLNIMKSLIKYDSTRKIFSINKDNYDLSQGRIFVIGGGKAAALMAESLEKLLGTENITAGVVNCKSRNHKAEKYPIFDSQKSKIKIIEAGHPIPDQRGVKGVKEMLALKRDYSIDKNDLVICLISGGGSALMPCPVDGISLKDTQKITELLLNSGAEINEINIVRKHLSKIKGGKLAQFFSPTRIVTLILSDVVNNDLETIASGPTCPDSSTSLDAYKILEKYNLLSDAPKRIIDFLKKDYQIQKKKVSKKILNNFHNYIIGDNRLALEAMAKKAKEIGFSPYIITSEQKGDPTTIAQVRAKEILNNKYSGYNLILIGGEMTPKLPKNSGQGGRNQHYAAVSMLAMKEYPNQWVLASLATDGSDFLSEVAGAIIDNNSLKKAETKGINIQSYLNKYNSYYLLKKIGHSLIITGNTGTNVGDIIVYALKINKIIN